MDGGGRARSRLARRGGALNALLIARFSLPPLIVTLGTLSLFRGLAEGMTGGADFVSGFPAGFLWLGQAISRGVPPQALTLAAVALLFAHLLHRTIYGRSWYAIGWSPEGARYAGIPVRAPARGALRAVGVRRRPALRFSTSRASGQAKADAGTGYELMAITAVVLGGTAITGGRGTIGGTLLGLAGIVVLQNGLRLADLPAELAGILTGALLLAAIAAPPAWLRACGQTHARRDVQPRHETELSRCGTRSWPSLCARRPCRRACIVAGSNWWTRAIARAVASRRDRRLAASGSVSGGRRAATRAITSRMMPKAKGDPYFVSCRQGAEEAARQLGRRR